MNAVVAGLLLFWGLYFSLAGTGNLLDLLKQIERRGRYFKFSSGNYELLSKVASKYGTPPRVIKSIFAFIMSWELLSAASYLAALALYVSGSAWFAQYAFFTGMGLFAGLVLGNEMFVFYEDEEEHVVLLMAQLISYIAFAVLG